MQKQITATRVVRTSFLVDISDVVLNLFVAVISGSAVMLVEAMQGGADLLTSGLLLVGVRKSKRAADRDHRFGFGREIYFWTLMSGLMMLTVTATVSFYHGWQQFFSPRAIENVGLALGVLAIGLTTNLYAFILSYKRLKKHSQGESLLELFQTSSLIETKAAFSLDLMGAISALFGLISLLFYSVTGNAQFDGLGAMLIGITIALLALLLILDAKDVLVGRGASKEIEQAICATALALKGVEAVLDLRTMYIGSNNILVNMELDMDKNLTTEQLERLIDIIKSEIKSKVPSVRHIQLELETPHREKASKIRG